ncbi:hypothetical protein [Acidicapsa acidisoli]|uniref:hypothetical protein n=1 Tax=Acidicapsa acidisoli TaxID=1615681 RepID=UPI0021E06C43|nr:hypothetical protein [Acidicapsa acidisoli]
MITTRMRVEMDAATIAAVPPDTILPEDTAAGGRWAVPRRMQAVYRQCLLMMAGDGINLGFFICTVGEMQ